LFLGSAEIFFDVMSETRKIFVLNSLSL